LKISLKVKRDGKTELVFAINENNAGIFAYSKGGQCKLSRSAAIDMAINEFADVIADFQKRGDDDEVV